MELLLRPVIRERKGNPASLTASLRDLGVHRSLDVASPPHTEKNWSSIDNEVGCVRNVSENVYLMSADFA